MLSLVVDLMHNMPVPEDFRTYEGLLRLAAPGVFDGYVARLRVAYDLLERTARAMKSEPHCVAGLLPAFVGVMNGALPRTADEEAFMGLADPCIGAYYRGQGDYPGSSWKYLMLASGSVDDITDMLDLRGVIEIFVAGKAQYGALWLLDPQRLPPAARTRASEPESDSEPESESALELEPESEPGSESEPESEPAPESELVGAW